MHLSQETKTVEWLKALKEIREITVNVLLYSHCCGCQILSLPKLAFAESDDLRQKRDNKDGVINIMDKLKINKCQGQDIIHLGFLWKARCGKYATTF